MPLATLARRAGALLLAGAGLISATGTAHATGTYTAVVFPDQSHTVVYKIGRASCRERGSLEG